jgi:hypothetical protein
MAQSETKNDLLQRDYGQTFFSWKFFEHPKRDRDKKWYITGSIIVILVLIYSIFTFNFLFALIAVIAALIILLFERNNNEIEFKITEDGILLSKKFYEYKDLKNFYIIYQPPAVKTLYFEPKGLFIPRIPIPLENQNPVKIRETLLKYLEEDLEKEEEPISDFFSRIFKL